MTFDKSGGRLITGECDKTIKVCVWKILENFYTRNEWRRCENYTRNEWRRCEIYTRNEWKRFLQIYKEDENCTPENFSIPDNWYTEIAKKTTY